MKILLLNDAYFLSSLRRLGHSVYFVSVMQSADLKVDFVKPTELDWVFEKCPFVPDFVLYSDSINVRCVFTGFERAAVPLVFFGVDSPMNAFWQFDFARGFDLVFLDQREPVERLRAVSHLPAERIIWLPLAADPQIFHRFPVEKKYDISFVGSLHPVLRPKRSWLLEEIGRCFNIAVFDGANRRSLQPVEVAEIYNRSRLVLNECLFPGINLRWFEVMSCGACLLTEEGDGSWRNFFQDGHHLVIIRPDSLIKQIESLLKNDEARERIAAAGMKSVQNEHTIEIRTRSLLSAAFQLVRNRASAAARAADRTFFIGKTYITWSRRWRKQYGAAIATRGADLLYAQAVAGRETAQLHFELAAYALEEQRHRDALKSLRRALELDPAHLRSVWALFWCYFDLNERRNALLEIRRLCQYLRMEIDAGFVRRAEGSNLNPDDYFALGVILEESGWLLEPGIERSGGHPCRWNAFDAYQKAIALDPSFYPALIRCADILEKYHCADKALLFIRRAVELLPDDADLRLRYAGLLLTHYRRREAFKQIFRYLITAIEADKWERVERLKLTESEWHRLLDAVWKYSRKSREIAAISAKRIEIHPMRKAEVIAVESRNASLVEQKEN